MIYLELIDHDYVRGLKSQSYKVGSPEKTVLDLASEIQGFSTHWE